jgi:hypothetical protein
VVLQVVARSSKPLIFLPKTGNAQTPIRHDFPHQQYPCINACRRFFVSTDAAALSHMDDCAVHVVAFLAESALESAHCMLFPRLITAVAVGVVVVAALTIVCPGRGDPVY